MPKGYRHLHDHKIHDIVKNEKREQIYCCSHESLYKEYRHVLDLWLRPCMSVVVCLASVRVICFLCLVSLVLSLRTKITLWNSSWMLLSFWEGQLCQCGTVHWDLSVSRWCVPEGATLIVVSCHLRILRPFLKPANHKGYWGKVWSSVWTFWDLGHMYIMYNNKMF